MIVNFRLMDEEEDDAWLNWELVFNLVTAAIAVVLVFWLGGVGIKGALISTVDLSKLIE